MHLFITEKNLKKLISRKVWKAKRDKPFRIDYPDFSFLFLFLFLFPFLSLSFPFFFFCVTMCSCAPYWDRSVFPSRAAGICDRSKRKRILGTQHDIKNSYKRSSCTYLNKERIASIGPFKPGLEGTKLWRSACHNSRWKWSMEAHSPVLPTVPSKRWV